MKISGHKHTIIHINQKRSSLQSNFQHKLLAASSWKLSSLFHASIHPLILLHICFFKPPSLDSSVWILFYTLSKPSMSNSCCPRLFFGVYSVTLYPFILNITLLKKHLSWNRSFSIHLSPLPPPFFSHRVLLFLFSDFSEVSSASRNLNSNARTELVGWSHIYFPFFL